ncbi:Serine protease [Salmonella enterica subsp. enterica serovar Typhi str. P-stx-12]|nr:Serine protease [Salmonella enterica subsp. enterica serovar Typhi str. P-stx-12]AXR55184.1 putative serine protease [Salmonella enterica subsp. enterica serovar Typhi]
MRNKTYNPLIGRTGVALGKTFSDNDWSWRHLANSMLTTL